MRNLVGFIGIVGLLVVGCANKAEDTKADSSAPAAPKSAVAPGTTAPATAIGANTAAPATAAAPVAPTSLPPGRTALPTVEEWKAMTKEVTVKGSSALGCETKMIREYLRISCRGKNDTGGTPKHVTLQKGMVENHMYVDHGIVSLVVPYVEGINVRFVFTWSDTAHPLELKWPRGAPKPIVLGVFEGAKSPLDGTAIDKELVGRCKKELSDRYGDLSDDGLWELLSLNKNCLATYRTDCKKLDECTMGEPSAPARCPSNTKQILSNVCIPRCDANRRCSNGATCSDDGEGNFLCFEAD